MKGFGCSEIHALKDCSMIKAAVVQHPSFDVDRTRPLASDVSCGRCECLHDNDYADDSDYPVCDHCEGSCWCEQRYWDGPVERGRFDVERTQITCSSCWGEGTVPRLKYSE
jgi:hypothetical protein